MRVPIMENELNIGDKGKLLERGGRKATGLNSASVEQVSRVAVFQALKFAFLVVLSYDDLGFFGAGGYTGGQ